MEMIVYLSDGDITKRDIILDSFTLEESEQFLKYKAEAVVIRKGIISLFESFGKDESKDKKVSIMNEYCKLCKKRKLKDCSTCNKTLEVIIDGKSEQYSIPT